MKKVIPFGKRILVKRREVGELLGKERIIIAADKTRETTTDIADVLFVPDHTRAAEALLEGQEDIISSLTKKLKRDGDPSAFQALQDLDDFIATNVVREGDAIFLGKYCGIDFEDTKGNSMTMARVEDIIGLVIEDKEGA